MLISSLRELLGGGSVSITGIIAQIASVLCIIFLILPFHEFAHGWMANKLGDSTAKTLGRLTLNPLASIDYKGALFLMLFGFGWAKPVPVNSRYFKNPRRDLALVALAGPVANLIAALGGALIYCGMFAFKAPSNVVTEFILVFLWYYIAVNVSLALFNLLPVPPLDGSKILSALLPARILQVFYRYEKIIVVVCMALLFMGVFSRNLSYVQGVMTELILKLARLPYAIFGLL